MKIYGIFEDCNVFVGNNEENIDWGNLTSHFIKSFGYFTDLDKANEFAEKQEFEDYAGEDGEDEHYYVMEIELNMNERFIDGVINKS